MNNYNGEHPTIHSLLLILCFSVGCAQTDSTASNSKADNVAEVVDTDGRSEPETTQGETLTKDTTESEGPDGVGHETSNSRIADDDNQDTPNEEIFPVVRRNCSQVQASQTVDIQSQEKNMSFKPAAVSVSAGDIVQWTNVDVANNTFEETLHTITSGEPKAGDRAAFFDLGRLGTNEKRCLKFNAEGAYPYFCRVHPERMEDGVVKVGNTDSEDIKTSEFPGMIFEFVNDSESKTIYAGTLDQCQTQPWLALFRGNSMKDTGQFVALPQQCVNIRSTETCRAGCDDGGRPCPLKSENTSNDSSLNPVKAGESIRFRWFGSGRVPRGIGAGRCRDGVALDISQQMTARFCYYPSKTTGSEITCKDVKFRFGEPKVTLKISP